MKLNKSGKEELRETIEEELKNYDGDEKIHIDKDLLESLIFEKDIALLPDDRKLEVKFIVWSGPFLSKIDLSEVSFDNVEWDINTINKIKYQTVYGKDKLRLSRIFLSNTNAKIDFSKSFSKLAFPNWKVRLSYCDFENVDLSNANGELLEYIDWCNLKNTKIKLDLNPDKKMLIMESDLSKIDLSNITVPASVFTANSKLYLRGTTLCDTGIHIEYRDYSNLPSGIIGQYISMKKNKLKGNDNVQELRMYEKICYEGYNLSILLSKGMLDGCYINGKYKLNSEERRALKSTLLDKYDTMKKGIINSTREKISGQIRLLKK